VLRYQFETLEIGFRFSIISGSSCVSFFVGSRETLIISHIGLPAVFILTLSDPTSDLVRQYDFSVPLRYRKTSDTVFVAFFRPLSEPVRRFSSCSTDFSQQIVQVLLFLFLHVFSLLKL
jgi:hypothetical protein